MERVVEPEWLDELPATDPRALASRRDIRRLNRVMGHFGRMRDLLEGGLDSSAPSRFVEIGAGDGTFMLRIAKHFSGRWKNVEVVLVDFKDAVSEETRDEYQALGWRVRTVKSDIFEWLRNGSETADAIIANLFLHQFRDAPLQEMLRLCAARTKVFAACEPPRGDLALFFSRFVGVIGCNAVTRRDAVLSVQAGFAGKEISALWPNSPEWSLREEQAGWFSHVFSARRI